jgi:cobalt-zinc-cadmium efflux system membrane fusion protein
MKKWMILCIVIGMCYLACGSREKNEEQKEENVSQQPGNIHLKLPAQKSLGLRIETVSEQSVQTSFQTTGIIVPDESKSVDVRALSKGRILEVRVRTGDRVSKDALLAVYDNIELGDLAGEYRERVSELQLARSSFERAERLLKAGAIAQSEFEKRKSESQVASAEVSSLKQKLRVYGLSQNEVASVLTGKMVSTKATIRSPESGVVTDVRMASGETIEENQDLFTVVNMNTVWFQADVAEKDLRFVSEGKPVQISFEAYPDRKFTGSVTYVSDAIDPETRKLKVRCEVPNSQQLLKLQMFGTAEIVTDHSGRVLAIRSSALQQIHGKQVVFVQAAAETFQSRPVQVGKQHEDWIEVRGGLQPGEKVVTEGSYSLKSIAQKGEIEAEED